MNRKCIICDSNDVNQIFEIPNAPMNIQALLTKDQIENDSKITLKIFQCKKCNLVQLGNSEVISSDYYDDYVMTASFSSHLSQYTKNLAKKLIQEYGLKQKNILEIGCGDGFFSKQLENEGAKVIGIEPSKKFGEYAKKNGINVIHTYFHENADLPINEFDAIVSRQVFEHLKNPNEVMLATKKFLKNGGIGMIEVPSFEKALQLNRYYDIFSDHVSYYTKETLSNLALLNGFEVSEVFDSFDNEFIVIIFKKSDSSIKDSIKNKSNPLMDEFIKNFERYKVTFNEGVKDLKTKNKKIVVWGAGGKGNALLSMCDLDSNYIDYVIDSDPKKIGKYTIGSHLFIKSPEVLKEDLVDVIIISAMAYEAEILKKLDEFEFKGDVYVISPWLRKVISKN